MELVLHNFSHLPFSKLQKTTPSCLDLKCYIYLSLFSLQATREVPAVMQGEKIKQSVAKV